MGWVITLVLLLVLIGLAGITWNVRQQYLRRERERLSRLAWQREQQLKREHTRANAERAQYGSPEYARERVRVDKGVSQSTVGRRSPAPQKSSARSSASSRSRSRTGSASSSGGGSYSDGGASSAAIFGSISSGGDCGSSSFGGDGGASSCF
jgi:uncharacterized membrane protein YgcG